MDRKSKPSSYIEPIPKKKLRRLIADFERIGGKVLMNDNVNAYLSVKKAEACTLNGYTILLNSHPGRAAVYEELFHAQQFREGKNDGSHISVLLNEIEAQQYLLDNKDLFELTTKEVIQTEKALKTYQNELILARKEIPRK